MSDRERGGDLEKEGTERYPLIGIVGPVGSGKTSLSRLVETSLSTPEFAVETIEEHFPENPFLRDFYASPKDFSFRSQLFFLSSKVEQLEDVSGRLKDRSIIIDPALDMDRIFARVQHLMGWMTDDEYATYNELFDTLVGAKKIPAPDFTIVVNAPLDVLEKRIQNRGREFELSIAHDHPDYLGTLRQEVDNYYWERAGGIPIMRIDSGRMNFVSTPFGKADTVQEVLNWMSYYNSRDMNGHGHDGSNLVLPNYL